ncbi:MAG: methyltransferase domain-containing protein, partial [Novosphingobium sp.]|uniref:methyltransferase domain-containing protein n=1 Tax=Novosphingobium sp. TaxID=1874826 RepID=UPI003C7B3DD2
FKDVLRAIMEDGIRPSPQASRKWLQREITDVCGLLDERTVRYWLSGTKNPDDLAPLERAFFGNETAYRPVLRAMFRNAYEISQQLKDGVVSYAKFPTVPAFWDNVKLKLENHPVQHPPIYAENIRQAALVIGNMDPGLREAQALQIAEEARSRVFDDKYGDWKAEDDERYASGIELWAEEFLTLLTSLGVSFESKALVVGTGCGLEGVGIYDRFSELHGLDISISAVKKAKIAFPLATIRAGQAEDLPKSFRDFDVYISLKTYSSSFFDIESAVICASNALKSGGLFICSVPKGYGYDGNKFKSGLMRVNYNYSPDEEFATYSYLDKQLPFELALRIIRKMNRSLFYDVQIMTGHTEHYITAIRI